MNLTDVFVNAFTVAERQIVIKHVFTKAFYNALDDINFDTTNEEFISDTINKVFNDQDLVDTLSKFYVENEWLMVKTLKPEFCVQVMMNFKVCADKLEECEVFLTDLLEKRIKGLFKEFETHKKLVDEFVGVNPFREARNRRMRNFQ